MFADIFGLSNFVSFILVMLLISTVTKLAKSLAFVPLIGWVNVIIVSKVVLLSAVSRTWVTFKSYTWNVTSVYFISKMLYSCAEIFENDILFWTPHDHYCSSIRWISTFLLLYNFFIWWDKANLVVCPTKCTVTQSTKKGSLTWQKSCYALYHLNIFILGVTQ